MPSTTKRYTPLPLYRKIEALGQRIELVLEREPDPQAAMRQIQRVMWDRGLLENVLTPRFSSIGEFVMDVWTENPGLPNRLNLNSEFVPSPLKVKTLPDVLDMLPP